LAELLGKSNGEPASPLLAEGETSPEIFAGKDFWRDG